MKASVKEIRSIMSRALDEKGYSSNDTDAIIDTYLGGELRGHITHGLAPFPAFLRKDFSKFPDPEVVVNTRALFMIDAHSHSGIIVGRRAAIEAMDRAKKEAVGTAIVKNMTDWIRPGAVAQYIAEQGLVALVMSDGAGRKIAPPGGFDPTLGTNPIAYGIPTSTHPLVVDMATAKMAWGNVRLANKFGTDLPKDTYYTATGDIAVDPKDAYSVKPFGEHKGFSLALLNEIINGSMIGAPAMPVADASSFDKDWPESSAYIHIIDPRHLTDWDSFLAQTDEMLSIIRDSQTLPGESIRIPGEHAGNLQSHAEETDEIEIPDEIWDELKSL